MNKTFSFKALDRVLVRSSYYDTWKPDFFRDKLINDDIEYICCSGTYRQCIPLNNVTLDLMYTNYELDEYINKLQFKFGDKVCIDDSEKQYRFIKREHDGKFRVFDEITDQEILADICCKAK